MAESNDRGNVFFIHFDEADDVLLEDKFVPNSMIKADRKWLFHDYTTGHAKVEQAGHRAGVKDIAAHYKLLDAADQPMFVRVSGLASNFAANPAKFTRADNLKLADERANRMIDALVAEGVGDIIRAEPEVRGATGDNDGKFRGVEVFMGPAVNDRYEVFLGDDPTIGPVLSGTFGTIVIRDPDWGMQRRYTVTPDGPRRIPLERVLPKEGSARGLSLRMGNPSDTRTARTVNLRQFQTAKARFTLTEKFATMSGTTRKKVAFFGFAPDLGDRKAPLQPDEEFTATLTMSGKVETG